MNDLKRKHREVVAKARRGFAADLFATDYDRIHVDRRHVSTLLDLCPVAAGKIYLDLGTGNGDVAFALAGRRRDIRVIGLDIVPEAVAANTLKARTEGCPNVEFMVYDGMRLPFGDNVFAAVVCRYAVHHLPDAALTAADISRILEPGGDCIIADPVPAECDDADFINRFAALKDDGHVRFHDNRELRRLFGGAGFDVAAQTAGSIRFPRDLNRAYRELIEATPRRILAAYDVVMDAARVYVTFPVSNTRFRRVA